MLKTRRQQIIFVGLLIAIAVFVWQVIALMRFNDTAAPIEKPLKAKAEKDSVLALKVSQLKQKQAGNHHAKHKQPNFATVHKFMPQAANKNQKNYIKLMGQYQNLQIERRIVQTQEAIAQARLKIVETEEKLSKIKPMDRLVKFTEEKVKKPAQYKLVYTGKNQDQWMATLKHEGQLIDINLGEKLAGLGIATTINSEEVVFKNRQNTIVINFNGTKRNAISALASKKPSNVVKAEMTKQSVELNRKVVNAILPEQVKVKNKVMSYSALPSARENQVFNRDFKDKPQRKEHKVVNQTHTLELHKNHEPEKKLTHSNVLEKANRAASKQENFSNRPARNFTIKTDLKNKA
ncbi:MAG: hypothetical protein AAGG80_05710, partial [Pseudomonadota bacterium]